MKRIICLCLIISLFLGQGIVFGQEPLKQREDKLKEIEDQLEKTNQALEENRDALDLTEKDTREVYLMMYALEYTIKKNEIDILDQEAEIQFVQAELKKARDDLDAHWEEFGERLRVIYLKSEEDSKLAILLSSKNLMDLLNRIVYIKASVDEDKRVIRILKQKQDMVTDLEAKEQARLRELNGLQRMLDEDRRFLVVVREELAAREAELKELRTKLEAEQLALNESSEKIREEIDEMTVNAIAIAAKRSGSGNDYFKTGSMISATQGVYTIKETEWVWPTPQTKVVTSPFGSRMDPISGNAAFHEGIDIGGPMGTKINAAAGGIVTHSGWFSNGYGYAVILAHADGYTSVYAHGKEVAVEVGDIVEPGDLIMYMGSSGYSTGSHVHFEIVKSGQLVDPLTMVQP